MNITFQSALEYGIEQTAALLTKGFAGYFVPIQLTGAGLLTMVRQDSVDLQAGLAIRQDDQPVGVALVAGRGWTSRIAAMSIIPEARGGGTGEVCVRQLLKEASMRQGSATALLRAAIALHPDKIWRVAPHLPEEFGGLFERIGLMRDTLSQWQMTAIL